MNYIGPNDGEGLQIYHDLTNVVNVTQLRTRPNRVPGNRNLVLGRFINGGDYMYGSVQVDELYLFDRTLTEAEIRMLSQTTF